MLLVAYLELQLIQFQLSLLDLGGRGHTYPVHQLLSNQLIKHERGAEGLVGNPEGTRVGDRGYRGTSKVR